MRLLTKLRTITGSKPSEERRAEDRAQKLTDEHVTKIDELLKRKEEEIMEV